MQKDDFVDFGPAAEQRGRGGRRPAVRYGPRKVRPASLGAGPVRPRGVWPPELDLLKSGKPTHTIDQILDRAWEYRQSLRKKIQINKHSQKLRDDTMEELDLIFDQNHFA